MSSSVTGLRSSGSMTRESAARIASRDGSIALSVPRRGAPPRSARPARRRRRRRCASAPRGRAGCSPSGGPSIAMDREAALADEQLRGGEVDRARGLEADDRVGAARPRGGRSVIACAPMTRTRSVSGASAASCSATSAARVASIERNSISSFGLPVSGVAVEEGAAAAGRRPLLVRAEVVDVAEDDVVHRARPRRRRRESAK